ncbi:hypothetical protein [Streptomyces sp. 8N706]
MDNPSYDFKGTFSALINGNCPHHIKGNRIHVLSTAPPSRAAV